jgi:hypothetical protein
VNLSGFFGYNDNLCRRIFVAIRRVGHKGFRDPFCFGYSGESDQRN